MSEIDRILAASARSVARHEPAGPAAPRRHLAVVTCIDARIDVFAVLGLEIGDAHILRNAGGRVTDDVLRGLAVSCHMLGVDTVVFMEHTDCGVAQKKDGELPRLTGASLDFRVIDDHEEALRHDVEAIAGTPFLSPIVEMAGLLYNVETGEVTEILRWARGDSAVA